ncbi:hypothetical protein NST17_20930 [Caldifermentibacillus hisashii]|uniref:DUF2508 family protein n=1 Tax=Caldifermentibacillus hisashii TaxID=996558 RepID=A0ABU9K3F8_9BACI
MKYSERLEDIKERFMKYEYDYNLSGEDVEWLIEQAERVQEVEEELKELRAMYSVVNGERIRYKQAFNLTKKLHESS